MKCLCFASAARVLVFPSEGSELLLFSSLSRFVKHKIYVLSSTTFIIIHDGGTAMAWRVALRKFFINYIRRRIVQAPGLIYLFVAADLLSIEGGNTDFLPVFGILWFCRGAPQVGDLAGKIFLSVP